MQDPLPKILKLLALAQSSNSEEARSAVHLAAELIADHGIVLSLPGALAPEEDEPASYADLWETAVEKMRFRTQGMRARAQGWAKPASASRTGTAPGPLRLRGS